MNAVWLPITETLKVEVKITDLPKRDQVDIYVKLSRMIGITNDLPEEEVKRIEKKIKEYLYPNREG